ncbi:MAG: hypothetical protein CL928_08690 [Deltaproteobacteria bacterium]|nr:hypothetical protein [Deltaproteobacteria bacterium]
MAKLSYDDSELLRDARLRYWRANGFGDDGGYNKKWEVVKLGPIPFPVRNVDARKDAIRYHDLNHLITGYDTDLTGETEIAAWEIASGCGTKWVAWLLNLQAILISPLWARRALQAWARGRRSKSLYSEPFDDTILNMTVGELREKLDLAPVQNRPNSVDLLTFITCLTASFTAHLAFLCAGAYTLWWCVRALL